jgi:hypothetical protein
LFFGLAAIAAAFWTIGSLERRSRAHARPASIGAPSR